MTKLNVSFQSFSCSETIIKGRQKIFQLFIHTLKRRTSGYITGKNVYRITMIQSLVQLFFSVLFDQKPKHNKSHWTKPIL